MPILLILAPESLRDCSLWFSIVAAVSHWPCPFYLSPLVVSWPPCDLPHHPRQLWSCHHPDFKHILTNIQILTHKRASSPGGSDGKESACNVGDPGMIPELERSPGGGHGNPLQAAVCLENSMGRGAWQATVHRVAKSQTRGVANFHFHST